MFYYLVWVRSGRYHGSDPLTYSSAEHLKAGSIVSVELQTETVLGFIIGPTSKPQFKVKPLSRVYDLPLLPTHSLQLARWLQTYYPSPIGAVTQQFLPLSLPESSLNKTPPGEKPAELNWSDLPALTAEQKTALATINSPDTYLIHGVTGSGKTRLYIELAAKAIEGGKSAIVLTPEISLTSQLENSFAQVFGDQVVLMHSQQAPSERVKAWLKCLRSDHPLVVIGPRSALFSPLQKIGLIVIDESHEAAYKQEKAPQYLTGRVSAALATFTRSKLILGSATPSVNDYYLAQQKHKTIIQMTSLARKASDSKQPSTTTTETWLVDLKDREQFVSSRSSHLSLPLIKAIETALKHNQQTLLYLNRRGTARLVLCDNCGWQAVCPHCDIPLTYHADFHDLRCHSCSWHEKAPSSCPECHHPDILYRTAGTKGIVEEVERLFPGARVARFDTDNLRAERFERHYDAVKRGDVDILVGTQLLAKGLDLPLLSTLGVLLADTSLYLPDFSSQERTFQLITQVLGRIGRGHLSSSRAVIQTYHPDHPVFKAAIEGDYSSFYETELQSRRQFMFPPFCYLLKLTVRRATARASEAAANKFKEQIESSGLRVRVEGPAPSFYEKLGNKYQWQLIVKAKNRSELVRIVTAMLPHGWSADLDPLDLL